MTRIVEIERCGKQCRYYYDCYISQKKYCDHPDTFPADNSLFKQPCYAKRCVYNVSSVCKCSTVGSVCQSYVANGRGAD